MTIPSRVLAQLEKKAFRVPNNNNGLNFGDISVVCIGFSYNLLA